MARQKSKQKQGDKKLVCPKINMSLFFCGLLEFSVFGGVFIGSK